MHYLDETHILLFLVQVFILLLATRGLGEIFRRWNQPALTAELLVGILLGPTILGRFLPGLHRAIFPPDLVQQNMLETVAWIGVLFLLLETGLEIHFSVAWRQRGSALTIALADIIIPMVVAFLPCLLLPDRYLADPDRRIIFALFVATAMTISAMPVAARALHDLNLLKADLGFLIMSALAVNDIVGWVLFTIVLGFFTESAVSLGPVAAIFAATVGFAALALTLGRRVSTRALDVLKRFKLPEPSTSLTFACLLGLLFGAVTQKLGIHALFGFFLAGVVMGEARNLSEQSRGVISQMVYAIFVPLFFANIGLKIDFATGFDPFLVTFVTAIGIAGRYLGAWVGVGLTRAPRADRHFISIAHTPGGMMEVVVALLALESGLITIRVFVAVVFSAVFSSVIVGPWMRAALARRAAIRLLDLLHREAVLPELAAASRDDAIRELAVVAGNKMGGDARDRLVAAALARENEFGTGIGSGVAIPHVRLEGIRQPVVVFGHAAGGIDWDAPDGQPVRDVFLVVTPAGAQDVHVQILAEIARVLQAEENRKKLDRAADAAELWAFLQAMFSSARSAVSPGK
ncbi:MAG: cation:proton antiporter [Lentisphaeria bacterium]|nr:cation:proton antiporter [Lentisphaeria bacterium]